MGALDLGARAVVVAAGVALRWWELPLPWWAALVALVAVIAHVDAVVSLLSRRAGWVDKGLRASLGVPARWLVVSGVAVAVAGWLLALTGIVAAQGQPSDDGVAGCRFYLSAKGERTCISEADYRTAVAQGQSMVFGGAACFLGFGAIAVGRRRRG